MSGCVSEQQLRNVGNECFRRNDFDGAISAYTRALEQNSESVLLYTNRSAAHLKLENFGYALADAEAALKLDGTFVKAYYRKASALMALGRYKEALGMLEVVMRLSPSSSEARAKANACKKLVTRQAFERAIRSDSAHDYDRENELRIDWQKIDVEEKYRGPKIEGNSLSEQFISELLPFLADQKRLHRRYAYQILMGAKDIFKSLPTLVHLNIPLNSRLTVCGDIHGQFYDLLNIFKMNGLPSPTNPYLFNGDFVDRGSFSIECIISLLALKLLYPEHVHLTRGNHETINLNEMYGFQGECEHKYSSEMFTLFTQIFNYLPLAYVVNESVLIVHGGLSSQTDLKLDDIARIDRNRQPPESGVMCDLLWSDPDVEPGINASKRGVGCHFGPDVSQKFCQANNIQYVIRSHEVRQDGYDLMHDGRLITIFSAPNYCDTMGNKGAYIHLAHTDDEDDLLPKFTSFTSVPHPPVKPMAYAKNLGMFGLL